MNIEAELGGPYVKVYRSQLAEIVEYESCWALSNLTDVKYFESLEEI